jgi:hypothetical protein
MAAAEDSALLIVGKSSRLAARNGLACVQNLSVISAAVCEAWCADDHIMICCNSWADTLIRTELLRSESDNDFQYILVGGGGGGDIRRNTRLTTRLP